MPEKKQSKKGNGFDHLFFARILEKFVQAMRSLLTEKLLNFCTKWLVLFGHYSIYAASALAVLFGIIGAIRLESFTFFLYSLGFAVGILIVQYIANKFSNAGETLINVNSSRLSSSAFLDSLGLISLISGVLVFLYQLYLAIKLPAFQPLLWGIGAFILLEFIALVALNPRTITVDVVKETTAGEEAIGIMTFFIKKLMKLVPIVFGLGLIIATILLFISAFGLFSQSRMGLAGSKIMYGYKSLILIGMLPFLSYIYFVFVYLVIDIIKAILSIPGKLDKLKK